MNPTNRLLQRLLTIGRWIARGVFVVALLTWGSMAIRDGEVGAARVKERYGVEQNHKLGTAGRRKLVEARGVEHLAAIGRIGGWRKKASAPAAADGEAA